MFALPSYVGASAAGRLVGRNETGHSTQKPVECMLRPIENNSSQAQAVYEPSSGSGTTIIAAEMTGRSCHAIELNPSYVDMAVLRWQEFTGEQAVLEGDGAKLRPSPDALSWTCRRHLAYQAEFDLSRSSDPQHGAHKWTTRDDGTACASTMVFTGWVNIRSSVCSPSFVPQCPLSCGFGGASKISLFSAPSTIR